jgi:hypothetical protein
VKRILLALFMVGSLVGFAWWIWHTESPATAAAVAPRTSSVASTSSEKRQATWKSEQPTGRAALENSQDLYASYLKVKASKRSEDLYVANELAGWCEYAFYPLRMSEIIRRRGELNSTDVLAPSRAGELAKLVRQQAALEKLQTRCAGFKAERVFGHGLYRQSALALEEGEGALSDLLRRRHATEGTLIPTPEVNSDLQQLLLSHDPIAIEAAVDVMFQMVPDNRQQRLAFDQRFAYLVGAREEFGDDRSDGFVLALCAAGGPCTKDEYKSASHEALGLSFQDDATAALWNELTEKYRQALRTGDAEAIPTIRPSRPIPTAQKQASS